VRSALSYRHLATAAVHLATPTPAHAAELLAAVARSRRLHGGWVSPPRTRAQLAAYLRRVRKPSHRGYLICTRDGAIAGVVNVNEIVRGAFRSAYLGYYALAPHDRHGWMTAGLRLVVARAFTRLGLHRLEANIQPGNGASRRLVQRLGFQREGYSPRYLKVAGEWRDHERWALTVEDWKAAKRAVSRARRASPRAAARWRRRRSRA